MTNLEVARLLRNISACYQFKGFDKYRFQIIAYDRAATSVEHLTSELKDLWDDHKLDEVPGVGPSISSHLDEIFKTGKSKHFEELMQNIPKEAFKLMELPKIGLKTAIKFINEKSKAEIDNLLKQVEKQRKNKRLLLPYAKNIASEVVEWLLKSETVDKVDYTGSLRRNCSTIGDIDILVSAKSEKLNLKIINRFVNYPKIQKIIEKGEKTASILLPNNIQVDLLVCKSEEYGSALCHFTGSKFHNIALREYAQKNGYSLSEYGIKKLNDKKTNAKFNTFNTEQNLYSFLKLDYIEPELREGVGEIEKAVKHKLPKLVTIKDIKGDLHIHSNFDVETSHDLGISSMKDIVKKAIELKYQYIAFTEHNPSKHQHSPAEVVELLKRKREKIEQLNCSRVIKVFNGLEIDINKDGTLPLSNEALETLDFGLISIHSSFDLPKQVMTDRILRAFSYPKVKVFAHPTARKLNEREGIELDWPRIFEFCVKNNKFLEINSDPARLDLPDVLIKDAIQAGVKMTLGTDSHEVSMLNNMQFGLNVARRGWCEKKNIINSRSLKEFEEVIL